MAESFLLAWRALLRGHVLTALLVLTALAHLLLPAIVRSDGTDAGGQEVFPDRKCSCVSFPAAST